MVAAEFFCRSLERPDDAAAGRRPLLLLAGADRMAAPESGVQARRGSLRRNGSCRRLLGRGGGEIPFHPVRPLSPRRAVATAGGDPPASSGDLRQRPAPDQTRRVARGLGAGAAGILPADGRRLDWLGTGGQRSVSVDP